jgi:hypothetical protein
LTAPPASARRVVIVIVVIIEQVAQIGFEPAPFQKAFQPMPGAQLVRTDRQQVRAEIADIEIRLFVPLVIRVVG